MKIIYDKEADALYIRLLEGEYESRVVRLGERESWGSLESDLHMSLWLCGSDILSSMPPYAIRGNGVSP